MNWVRLQMTTLLVLMLCVISCSDEAINPQLSRNTWDVDLDRPWQPADPDETDFDKMFAHFWMLEKTFISGRISFDKRLDVRHIRLPRYPKPENTPVNKVHKWRIVYRSDREFDKRESKALEKFDSLAEVGLLVKANDSMVFDGPPVPVYSYTLSKKGWKYLRHSGNPTEFSFGAAGILGIEKVRQHYTDEQVGIEMYGVTAKIGIETVEDLAPWARDPRVRKLFPKIDRALKGKTETRYFIRGARGWTDFRRLRNLASNRSQPVIVQVPENYSETLKNDYKLLRKYQAKRESLPPPSESELKALIKKKVENRSSNLPLPGDSKLPVDAMIGPGYRVVIIDNKERKTHKDKRIVQKTLPFIKKLVDSEIMVRETVKGWDDPSHPNPGDLVAGIYSFAPDLAIPFGSGNSISLGKFTLTEFVDFVMYKDGLTGDDRFRYRYLAKIESPPAWAKNPKLLNAWDDLRNAIEIGLAGDGDLGFDREARDTHSGSSSSWWAFHTAADGPR